MINIIINAPPPTTLIPRPHSKYPQLDDGVHNMLPRVPIPLQEATSRLVNKQPGLRPTAQLLQLIKYFR